MWCIECWNGSRQLIVEDKYETSIGPRTIALREATNAYPGRILNEAVEWDETTQRFVILPRKESQDVPYDPIQDETWVRTATSSGREVRKHHSTTPRPFESECIPQASDSERPHEIHGTQSERSKR